MIRQSTSTGETTKFGDRMIDLQVIVGVDTNKTSKVADKQTLQALCVNSMAL